MDYQISGQDVQHLEQILEEANKSYSKEVEINQKASFNILRVLSAFRLLYPDAPSSLYNCIIYLTKIFNPQTFSEWRRAIYDWRKMKKLPPKNYHHHRKAETSKYMKTYQNSFNRQRVRDSHFQSKSFAQIKVPRDVNSSRDVSADLSKKDVTETNIQTGKRQFYTKADSIGNQSKHHYISFEPQYTISGDFGITCFEKENANSTNIGEQSRRGQSASQYIDAIRRQLTRGGKNEERKSPIQQSFIKNIDCCESPYLMSQANLEPIDPEEQQMNQRALQFLNISLKFKAFESLVANTMVYIRDKEYRMKADLQYKGGLMQRSFEGLKNNFASVKKQKQRQGFADIHFKQKSKKKVLNILKLLFDLRNKTSPLQTSKLNPVSYQFILSLLLSIQGSKDEPNWIDFDSKISQLIEDKQIDKVCLIVKYFGKNAWINQESIEKLIESYRKSLMSRVFKALNCEKQSQLTYSSARNKKLMMHSLVGLKNRVASSKAKKLKLMEAQGMKNKKLLSKVMKGLIEVVYSVKIYSKRCEYLSKKYGSRLKNDVFNYWLERAQERREEIEDIKRRVKMMVIPFTSFCKKYAFRHIKEDACALVEKEEELYEALVKLKGKNILKTLKKISESREISRHLAAKEKHLSFVRGICRWKQSTKKGKALKILGQTMKKVYIREVVGPVLKESIEEMKVLQQKQLNRKIKVFAAFKNWCKAQNNQHQELQNNIRLKFAISNQKEFLKELIRNKSEAVRMKRIEENELKSQQLRKYLITERICEFRRNIDGMNSIKEVLMKKNIQLENSLKKKGIIQLRINIKSDLKVIRNFNEVRQKLKNKRSNEIGQSLRKGIVIFKITKLMNKSLFFMKLKHERQNNTKLSQLSEVLVRKKEEKFLLNLKKTIRKGKGRYETDKKEEALRCWLVINKMKINYVQSLINKKYQFMAVKFRALKVCKTIFQKWKSIRFQPSIKLKSHSMQIRYAKERLSTDILQ